MTLLASDKQVAYVSALAAEYASLVGVELAASEVAPTYAKRSKAEVSRNITDLRGQIAVLRDKARAKAPVQTPTPEAAPVKAGRYCLGDIIVKVDTPEDGRWAGYVFVNEIDEKGKRVRSIRDRAERTNILDLIAANPEAHAVAYGRRTGTCGVCGRKLTKQASIDAGIGPVCASGY